MSTSPPTSSHLPPKTDVHLPFPGVVTNPQEQRFETNAWYWLDREAETGQAALSYVEAQVDPVMQAVFSVAAGHVVSTAVVNVQTMGEGGAWSNWSGGLFQPLRDVATLDPTSMASLRHRISKNKKARRVAVYLHRANKLASVAISAGEVAADGSLLEYAKAIELMARDRRFARTSSADDHEVRASLIERLGSRLSSDVSTTAKVSAIREARIELDRIDLQMLNLRVAQMAAVLELGADWLTLAVGLLTVRNQKLAHPGELLSDQQRVTFLQANGQAGIPAARDLVQKALIKYLG